MLDSPQLRGAVRKAIAGILGFLLCMILLTAITIAGFYLLTHAAVIALAPYLGQAASMAVVGFGCVLLLAIFFWRLTASSGSGQNTSRTNSPQSSGLAALQKLIRENPLESAVTAFAVGIAQQQTDPQLRKLLLQGGMELMERAGEEQNGATPASTAQGDG